MPTAATSRSQRIILRVSPAEKALVAEQAQAAGLKVSEYIRREAGIGKFGRADLMRRPAGIQEDQPQPPMAVLEGRSADFEQRVRDEMRTMPKVNAERLVRREEARERAKALVG